MPDETAPILLDGNVYVAKLPIRHYDVKTQTEPFRTTGAFLRINNPKLEPYAFNDWHRGFGTRFIRPGHPEDRQGFYEATVLTIWKDAIMLPPNRNSTTSFPSTHDGFNVRGSAKFSGASWFLCSPVDVDTGAVDTVVARNISGTTFGGGGNVLAESANTNKVRGFDMIAAGGKLYAICGLDNDHILRYSTDGITWTAPVTTPPPLNQFTSAATMIDNDAGARLAWGPGTTASNPRIALAFHDEVVGQIEIWDSTDGGDTWQSRVTFASGGGPTGIVAYLDVDDSVVFYVGTREGVWLVDLVPGTATAELILPLPTAALNGQRLTVHNAALYVPVDHGASAPFGMKRITVRDGVRNIEDVGLDQGQATPTTIQGSVYWMESAGPFLFVLISATSFSRIITITGLHDDGWQNVRYTSNPARNFITDGNHIIITENGATSTSAAAGPFRLNNILAVPTSGATFVFDTTAGGFDLELPEFGGDAPSEDGAFFQVQLDAVDLVDGAEVIDFEYGLNSASPTTAGVTLNNTNRRLALGTSSRGLSARTMRCNLEFNTGASGNSPKLREFVLLFRKNPAHLHGWEFEIDVEATKELRKGETDIFNDLETINHSDILVPFVEYQALGEVQVEMVNFERLDWIRGAELNRQNARVEGTIKIQLEEVLAH